MALELAKTAEKSIGDFFARDDALSRLDRLHSHTLRVVEDVLKAPRPQEFTHNVLDLAVQKVVEKLSWKLMTEAHATPSSVGVPALLDLCIAGVTGNFLINSTPYKVLEDLMEGQTINTCEKVWELLESRKDKLTTPDFIAEKGRTTKASLCLLRMCNALLRRLSKTHNSVFCGKILVFLSFTFALSERSAVNLTGKANVTNVTVFEDQDAFDMAEATDVAKASEVVPGLEIDSDPSADVGPIDYNLYRTFWDLQSFFREHQMATQSAENWEKFFTELNVVLAAFEGNAFSPDDLERSRDLLGSSGGATHSADVPMHEPDSDSSKGASEQGSQEHFFQPKYLTNSRLFRLQLRDPILRECMLTQFLILFNDLARLKPPTGSTTPKAKLAELTERVVALLKQTPSDGEGFNEMVSYVLERERNWVKWKQEKCPGYEKYPPVEKEGPSAPKPIVKRARRQLTSPLLEQILSESSKPSQILEKIKGKDRATEVSLNAYTDRFKEAWDPENGIEEEYWPDKDEMVCWRTMRAAMKGSVNKLDLAVRGTGTLVKGILGMDTTDASKETVEASTSTPQQAVSSPSPAGDAENDVVKEEQGEDKKKSDRDVLKDSPGMKRERSDSLKRVQKGNEPPMKRERVGRIKIRDDDFEHLRESSTPLIIIIMEEEESDDDFDYEQFLLAEQVRKCYYHGLYPFGIFVIWTLLRADCYDLSGCDSLGNPPIVYASKSGSTVLLRLLLYYKADINALSKLRETALIVACRNKRMKAIKFLLKRGAQTDVIDRAGCSALRWAVLHERVDMVRLLLLYNASVTKDCYTAGSALDIARQGISEQHAIILKELEKKLATERETLLVEIAESKKEDAIAEIANYREAKKETKALNRNQAPNATKRTRKLQVKQKSDPPRTRSPSHETSVGTRVPTPPIEQVAWKSFEITDTTSSNWLKVGKGQWKTQTCSPGTIPPSQDTTVVEAFAPDKETVHKLLTSDSKWKSFLHQQMPRRVSQDQLTVEDLD